VRWIILILLWTSVDVFSADVDALISRWLSKQTNFQTWTADFTQTRTLRALVQPLVSTGQVWFAAPQNFRWQLGENQTIAVRSNDTMVVVYPRLKRAEKYDFNQVQNNQWRDTLALLQTGFPRSEAEMKNQFNLLSLTETNRVYELQLQPKSLGARKMMPQINILLSTNDLNLAGTELVFVDGSKMRNEFRNVRTNVPVEGRFDLSVPADFKLVEPLKNR
jgi:outer membrane lipoprotein-sorting protein